MTSRCPGKKYDTPSGECSVLDRPSGGNTGRLFLTFGGPVCADRISNCPLDRVLTYKNLIYLLNLQFHGETNFTRHRFQRNCFQICVARWVFVVTSCERFTNIHRGATIRPGATIWPPRQIYHIIIMPILISL